MKELHSELPPRVWFHTVEYYVDYICNLIDRNRADGTLAGADVAERDVDKMLDLHHDRIAQLRVLVEDKSLPTPHEVEEYVSDDLWLLRYCMSFKKLEEAATNVDKNLKWRRSDEIEQWKREVRGGDYQKQDIWDKLSAHIAGQFVGTLRDGGLVLYYRGGQSANLQLTAASTHEEIFRHGVQQRMLISEVQLRVMHRARHIMKMAIVMDLKNMSMAELLDREANKTEGEVSKVSGYAFPQLLQTIAVVQPPGYFYYVYNIIKHFFPKKTLEKLQIIQSFKAFTESDLFKDWLNPDEVPYYLGGRLSEADCPPGLLGKWMNKEFTERSASISARSRTVVSEQCVTAGEHKYDYMFSVPGYGVEVSATVSRGNFDADGRLTKNGDIVFTPSGDARELLAPIKLKDSKGKDKPSSAESSTKGTWVVEGPCVITIVFNNENSMMRSKVCKYTIDCVDEDDNVEDAGAQIASLHLTSHESCVNLLNDTPQGSP